MVGERVGVCISGLGFHAANRDLRTLFTRCKRMSSTGVVASQRAKHSHNFNFIRVPSRNRNRDTVSTLGNASFRNVAVVMGMTHPGARRNGNNNCKNGHNNNNCGHSNCNGEQFWAKGVVPRSNHGDLFQRIPTTFSVPGTNRSQDMQPVTRYVANCKTRNQSQSAANYEPKGAKSAARGEQENTNL